MHADLDWHSDHRFILKVVNSVLDNGLAIGSVYATTGLGCAGESVTFLEQISQVLRALGRPLFGGDFNMSADTLYRLGVARRSIGQGHARTDHRPHAR
jgi:hypothetical protein